MASEITLAHWKELYERSQEALAAARRECDAAKDAHAYCLHMFPRDWLTDPKNRNIFAAVVFKMLDEALAAPAAASPAAAPAADQDEVAMFGAFGHGEPSEHVAPAPPFLRSDAEMAVHGAENLAARLTDWAVALRASLDRAALADGGDDNQ